MSLLQVTCFSCNCLISVPFSSQFPQSHRALARILSVCHAPSACSEHVSLPDVRPFPGSKTSLQTERLCLWLTHFLQKICICKEREWSNTWTQILMAIYCGLLFRQWVSITAINNAFQATLEEEKIRIVSGERSKGSCRMNIQGKLLPQPLVLL